MSAPKLAAVPSAPPAATPETLTEEAYRRLEELIVTLELHPGTVVSEAILAKRLSIGTTPIREALQRLSREHLVQILPRRGVVVTGVDVRLQLQVLETRRELDRLIVRCAARRATPAERQTLGTLAAQMEAQAEAGDIRGFMRMHGELSGRVAKMARNDVAAGTVAALHAVSRRFWFFHQEQFGDLGETGRLHAAVFRAVATADERAAARASDALIDHLAAFAHGTLALP